MSDDDASDRDAILSRRDFLIRSTLATALGSAALGLVASPAQAAAQDVSDVDPRRANLDADRTIDTITRRSFGIALVATP